MARFQPFTGVRYHLRTPAEAASVTSPPYDVFDLHERARLADVDPRNVVRIDYPVESDGEGRYRKAAETWDRWLDEGVLVRDGEPSLYLYRMEFLDEQGRPRRTVGVIGALEVADEGAGEVLPHEQTTPKAKSDRLDLLRQTRVNLSPVWGLVLGRGLTGLLESPCEVVVDMVDDDGVRHILERLTDEDRIRAVTDNVASAPVLIADGHHRYAVSRTYRDECGKGDSVASFTMTYLAELTPEQLSIRAIHRVIHGADLDGVLAALANFYDLEPASRPTTETLARMDDEGTLRLVAPDGRCWSMRERPGVFDGVPRLDSARLAHALRSTGCEFAYQHGLEEALQRCEAPATAVVLIRPVSIDAIRETAEQRALMPPKSTFFTPKLRTGMVFRVLDDAEGDSGIRQDAEAS